MLENTPLRLEMAEFEVDRCITNPGILWRKNWKCSPMQHTPFVIKIVFFSTFKCQARITMADIKWKYP
jgi:hypothetical protein